MANYAAQENVWIKKYVYDEAERNYYEYKEKLIASKPKAIRTPLAAEVERARAWLTNIKKSVEDANSMVPSTKSHNCQRNHSLENKTITLEKAIGAIELKLQNLLDRVIKLEDAVKPLQELNSQILNAKQTEDKGIYVDLLDSDSDSEGDDTSRAVRRKIVASYEANKPTKLMSITKCIVILDIKTWETETDFKTIDKEVRKIKSDGLVWGASVLVPVAYGIYKLQILCIIDDDKISVEWLEEIIQEDIADVQSVDIAACYKI